MPYKNYELDAEIREAEYSDCAILENMNTYPILSFRAFAVCMHGSAVLTCTAMAQIVSRSRLVAVEQPVNCSEQAPLPGNTIYPDTEIGDGNAVHLHRTAKRPAPRRL